MESIVAARGSIRTMPENTALSPIASSRMKAGRCPIRWEWNSAVLASTRALTAADSACARSFLAGIPEAFAATATASPKPPTFLPPITAASARASRILSDADHRGVRQGKPDPVVREAEVPGRLRHQVRGVVRALARRLEPAGVEHDMRVH